MLWITTIRDKLYESIAQEMTSLSQPGRVLDVGTGKGLLPDKIAEKNPQLAVYGVDNSQKAIDAARKNAHEMGIANPPEFYVGDVSGLSFEENYFDAVVSTFSLHHWTDPIQGLNEIFRVLKPGGQALIYDHWRDPSKKAREQLRKDHGWLLSSLALLHLLFIPHSVTWEDAEKLLRDPALKFQGKELKQQGIFLLLRLQKSH
jgi:ubiquinone/menaquinone biosynthesis C-methylase UbiE